MRPVTRLTNARGERRQRLLQWVALAGLVGGCHAMAHDASPLTPTAMCAHCCSQALDACMTTDGASVAAVCPPIYRQCAAACDSGDENEMCVVQTNRELASARPKPLLTAPAPPPEPKRLGECDQKGTWTLDVAHTEGKASGCVALAAIPKEVRFRVGRRHDAYVLYDLSSTPGWSDAFTIENGAEACVVKLRRDNRTEPDQPRSLALTITARNREVTGTLSYEEPNRPDGCALAAPIVGSVLPPPLVRPAAPPAWPLPPSTPAPTATGGHRI